MAWIFNSHASLKVSQLRVFPKVLSEDVNYLGKLYLGRRGYGLHGASLLAADSFCIHVFSKRTKYKTASFWNYYHAHKVLQCAANLQPTEESREGDGILRKTSKLPLLSDGHAVNGDSELVEPFIKDDILVEIIHGMEFSCSAEQLFAIVLADGSDFTKKYRSVRHDTDLVLEPWHETEEHGGLMRKVTYCALCNIPMCPPKTAMTEYQHVMFLDNQETLVFESIQQAHDVPFGSSFEVQARWTYHSISKSTCMLNVAVGTNFRKRFFMKNKIRSRAESEYKSDAALYIEVARNFLEDAKCTHI